MNTLINNKRKSGGKNTTFNGNNFEKIVNVEDILIKDGFKKKYKDYFYKTLDDKEIIYLKKNTFKKYITNKFKINMFRLPDQAYIINYKDGRCIIKILEIKEQQVDGSCETKLWSGPSLKREYSIVFGDKFEVCYGFCLSNFFKDKFDSNILKYNILKQILTENKIDILFGNNVDYVNHLIKWIHN